MTLDEIGADITATVVLGVTESTDYGTIYLLMRYYAVEALGLDLRDGDFERGVHVLWEAGPEEEDGPHPYRGVVACQVTNNVDDYFQPYHLHPDLAAVTELDVRRSLLDIGRFSEYIFRQGDYDGRLRFVESAVRFKVGGQWICAEATTPPGGRGLPSWVRGSGPTGDALGLCWRCELVLQSDDMHVVTVVEALSGLVHGSWHGSGERREADAAHPWDLASLVTAAPTGARVELRWTGVHLVEVGWLAALMEQRGFVVERYAVHDILGPDGSRYTITGTGASAFTIGGFPTDEFDGVVEDAP